MNNKKRKDNPNSLINRWLNDSNPVRVSGEGKPNGERIEIEIVDSIEELFERKL